MKKILLYFIICTALFSCRKNCIPKGTETNLGTKGVLHYDNFPDGWGLYYATDSGENLILKNIYSSDSDQYQHYKQFVNQHTRLNYLYHGETGCLMGIGPVCGIRVVEVVSFTKLQD
jgi:hypothetical protein